jgi:hypothetical protein
MLDTSMISFLAPAFVASLILTGIHAYLGVHVVERGVIFWTALEIAASAPSRSSRRPRTATPTPPIVY